MTDCRPVPKSKIWVGFETLRLKICLKHFFNNVKSDKKTILRNLRSNFFLSWLFKNFNGKVNSF